MLRNNEPIRAKITGRVRPDWNDPYAHLFTLDGRQITSQREAIGIPYYWQRVVGRPPVAEFFIEQRFVYRPEVPGPESPWRRAKLWLLHNRFFPLYLNQVLEARYVVKGSEPGHHHFVCAAYDDLYVEAFDVMKIIHGLMNDLTPIHTKAEMIEFLEGDRETEWEELNQALRLPREGDDYLDPYFIKLTASLARENESYFW